MTVATPGGENLPLQLVCCAVARRGAAAQPSGSNADGYSAESHVTATHLQAGHHEQVGDLCRVVNETVPVQQVNGAAAAGGDRGTLK